MKSDLTAEPPRLRPTEQAPPPLPAKDERRRTTRAALHVEVDWASDSNFYTGFSEDISEGGLFVATYQLAEEGTTLAITLELPNGEQIETEGVVRWLRSPRDPNEATKPGMGIEFLGLTEDCKDAIREFVANREPMFYPD